MPAAVPVVEVAHDRDAARVGRPDGEVDAGDALELDVVGTQLVEQPQMRALADVVVVERAEDGSEAVGVEDVPLAAGVRRVEADGLAPIDVHPSLEEAFVVPPRQFTQHLAVAGIGRDGLGVRDEGADHPDSVRLLQAQDGERVGILARDDLVDLVGMGLPLLQRCAFHCATGTCQMSWAYCRIVRSDENQPIWAVLRMAIEYHLRGFCQMPSTSACAAA